MTIGSVMKVRIFIRAPRTVHRVDLVDTTLLLRGDLSRRAARPLVREAQRAEAEALRATRVPRRRAVAIAERTRQATSLGSSRASRRADPACSPIVRGHCAPLGGYRSEMWVWAIFHALPSLTRKWVTAIGVGSGPSSLTLS